MHKDKERQLQLNLSATAKKSSSFHADSDTKHSRKSNIVDLSYRLKDVHNEAIIANLTRQGLLRRKT
jgi:hypothetical protein